MTYLPNPTDPRPFMLDISHYEANLNLDMIANFNAPKCHGAIFRMCGSASVKDTAFPHYWPWAKRAGLVHSIYMYNWPGWTVDLHIANFMDSVERYCDGDLGDGPIWVDAECHAEKSRREVSNHTLGCIEAIKRETGKDVGCYSAAWFLDGYMEIQDWMADIPWWWAKWYYNQDSEHPGPANFNDIIPAENRWWHQTGSLCSGKIFGGVDHVDTDRWALSEEEFNRIYKKEEAKPVAYSYWWPNRIPT